MRIPPWGSKHAFRYFGGKTRISNWPFLPRFFLNFLNCFPHGKQKLKSRLKKNNMLARLHEQEMVYTLFLYFYIWYFNWSFNWIRYLHFYISNLAPTFWLFNKLLWENGNASSIRRVTSCLLMYFCHLLVCSKLYNSHDWILTNLLLLYYIDSSRNDTKSTASVTCRHPCHNVTIPWGWHW